MIAPLAMDYDCYDNTSSSQVPPRLALPFTSTAVATVRRLDSIKDDYDVKLCRASFLLLLHRVVGGSFSRR